MATSIQTEEECWLNAACRVLTKVQRALHYNDIKNIISDTGLVPKGMKTTLEAALCKEVQSTHRRITPLPDRPGVFSIVGPDSTRDSTTATVSHSLRTGRSSTRYKNKYRLMKRYVRDLMFTNAAVCDEVVRLEEKLLRAKEERRYLLRRVMQRENTQQQQQQQQTGGAVTQRVVPVSKLRAAGYQTTAGGATGRPITMVQNVAQILGGAEKRVKKSTNQKRPVRPVDNSAEAGAVIKEEEGRNVKVIKRSRQVQTQQQQQIKLKVTPIDLDELGTVGRPVLPLELNTLTVYCLGEIIAQPGYYTADHIYPVGYCSTRLYLSIKPDSVSSLYTCKISDGGTAAKFEIAVEDMPGIGFTGVTPSQCHKQLLETICSSRGAGTVPIEAGLGAEFFGLSHPTIQNLIQSCAGARNCVNYNWVKFEPVGSSSNNSGGSESAAAAVYVETSSAVNMKLLESRDCGGV